MKLGNVRAISFSIDEKVAVNASFVRIECFRPRDAAPSETHFVMLPNRPPGVAAKKEKLRRHASLSAPLPSPLLPQQSPQPAVVRNVMKSTRSFH